jgi:glycosyltransferase involved in cell wall biosynthesis
MTDSNPASKRPHVHVLYEYGLALRPHSSPFLRLIRPLSHPLVQAHVTVTFGLDYQDEPADMVIIDRLWRRDISLQLVQDLIDRIRRKGARFIYSLDDNYFDLPLTDNGWPSKEALPIVSFLLHQADAVLVTTPILCQRLREYNPNIHILPNQLDERLLVIRHPSMVPTSIDQNRIVIGYMGTFTHDDDFMIVLPAFKSIHQRYPGRIEVQVIGVVNKEETKKELQALPIRYVYPSPEEHEYPLFMLWYTGHVHWDIAISPLQNTSFNNCKSDIKFLDYASIGAAGIFSQSPVYSSTVHHREDGWLAENTPDAWEQALETLIRDSALRLTIAQNASHHLYTERILAKRASDWVETIKPLC